MPESLQFLERTDSHIRQNSKHHMSAYDDDEDGTCQTLLTGARPRSKAKSLKVTRVLRFSVLSSRLNGGVDPKQAPHASRLNRLAHAKVYFASLQHVLVSTNLTKPPNGAKRALLLDAAAVMPIGH